MQSFHWKGFLEFQQQNSIPLTPWFLFACIWIVLLFVHAFLVLDFFPLIRYQSLKNHWFWYEEKELSCSIKKHIRCSTCYLKAEEEPWFPTQRLMVDALKGSISCSRLKGINQFKACLCLTVSCSSTLEQNLEIQNIIILSFLALWFACNVSSELKEV